MSANLPNDWSGYFTAAEQSAKKAADAFLLGQYDVGLIHLLNAQSNWEMVKVLVIRETA
jgi:hypothetical protein